ncbi:MAG: hypothetical protein ABL999_12360 [Pyrinomonadaceae bacterium]
MFCPKCGGQNPEEGKFCRSCGADLGNVSAALSGTLPVQKPAFYMDRKGRMRSNDPDEIYSSAIRSIIGGCGFLIVAIVLFTTGVANGHTWWWAMLFPAFSMLGHGVSQMAKVKRMEKRGGVANITQPTQITSPPNAALPPQQTNWAAPESRYKTGDLVPSSVTDNTTRHLEMDTEGKTMTLPKQ